ncbi:hypothetical protein Tco_0247043 [Tanacetum coccineum]
MATRGRKKAIAEPTPSARDPRDVETIERLQQRIQELEFQQLQQDSPAEETETESNVWDDGSEDVNPFGGGNPLLTKETESEPIIWDIGDEEEEYPFVNEYQSFKEEPIMFVEDESCPVYDTDNEEDKDGDEEEVVYTDNEEESEVIYDTNWNDVNDSPEFELLHPYQGDTNLDATSTNKDDENSRASFFQAGENDAEA